MVTSAMEKGKTEEKYKEPDVDVAVMGVQSSMRWSEKILVTR